MLSFRLKIRILAWLAVLALLSFFVYLKLAPSGQAVFSRDFSRAPMLLGGRGFIGRLSPAERLATTTVGTKVYPEAIGDPIYFSWRAPRGFDKLKVSVEYENSSPKPLSLSLGLLMDKLIWRYQLQPLAQPVIDRLSSSWTVIREGEVLLLQRQKNYDSIGQFLKKLPPPDEVALYNYNLDYDWHPAAAAPKTVFSAPYRLRGSYQFYSYIDGGLDLRLQLSDLNLNRDPDPISLTVYDRSGQGLASASLADDGVLGDTGERRVSRPLRLSVPSLKAGVYKIELRANDDIMTDKLAGLPFYTAFINKIWAAADPEKPKELSPVSFFTDSQQLRLKTSNPAALQDLSFAGRQWKLGEAYSQLQISASSTGWKPINLKKDDVLLEGDGLFSFTKESAFDPDFRRLAAYSDVSNLDYILARYQAPDCSGQDCLATAELDLSGAYRENGAYSLMLSLPELGASSTKGLIIKSLRLEATGKSLWQKIKERLAL